MISVKINTLYLLKNQFRNTKASMQNSKYKKIKHIEVVGSCEDRLKQRLIKNNKVTNQDFKRALSKLQGN